MDRSPACVLTGIDFSSGAMGALREARWLARRTGLGLQVLHVTEDGGLWRSDPLALGWLHSASLELAMVLVRAGLPWVEIVRHAREVSAAVIVLGRHGASGVQAMTLGSTASRVALRAPCPVLVTTLQRERQLPDVTATPLLHP